MKRGLVLLTFVILAGGLLLIPALLNFGVPAYSDMDDYFLKNGQEQTAANNIVTAVVFDYRGRALYCGGGSGADVPADAEGGRV